MPCAPPAAPPPPLPGAFDRAAAAWLGRAARWAPACYPLLFVLAGLAVALCHGEAAATEPAWPMLRRRLAGYYPLYLLASGGSLLVAQAVRGALTARSAHVASGCARRGRWSLWCLGMP